MVFVLILLWQPQSVRSLVTPNFPPLPDSEDGPARDRATGKNKKRAATSNPTKENNYMYHTSDFGARQNHPTSYDPSPPFLGPIQLNRSSQIDDADLATSSNSRSFNMGRERIRHYYQRQDLALSPSKPLKPSSPTKQKLKAIVDHLAYHNAPVDVKEVCESVEFVLRTRKRLLGAAKQQQRQQQQQAKQEQKQEPSAASSCDEATTEHKIHLFDVCCGHGLTGMLFSCCSRLSGNDDMQMNVILVDQTQPPSHTILLHLLTGVCPWLGEPKNAVTYKEATLDSDTTLADLSSSLIAAEKEIASRHGSYDEQDCKTTINLVISTHACGSLTDRVSELAASSSNASIQSTVAAAVAIMPCCYTGTSQGAPYGIQRALGVAWAADIQRSYYLQAQGYHTDFATIPKEITPMNRILIGEFKGNTKATTTSR